MAAQHQDFGANTALLGLAALLLVSGDPPPANFASGLTGRDFRDDVASLEKRLARRYGPVTLT